MKASLLFVPLAALAIYMVAMWLISLLGWTLILAAILWGIVLLGLARHTGRLDHLSGIPGRLLDRLTGSPAAAAVAAPAPPAARAASAMPAPTTSAARPQPAAPAKPDPAKVGQAGTLRIQALHGAGGVWQRLNELLAQAEDAHARGLAGFGAVAPASMVIFHGPHGTGKTTAAKAFAQILYGAGVIREANTPILESGYMVDVGPGGAYQVGRQAAEAALDGVLMIENAEWMTGQSQGNSQFAVEVSRGLMSVAAENPHRLLIIATGGPALRTKLLEHRDLRRELFGKLDIEEVAFEELTPDSLTAVFEDFARERQVRISAGLRPRLQQAIQAMRKDAGDHFDNATAVQRLFDQVLKRARRRQAGKGAAIELAIEDFQLEPA